MPAASSPARSDWPKSCCADPAAARGDPNSGPIARPPQDAQCACGRTVRPARPRSACSLLGVARRHSPPLFDDGLLHRDRDQRDAGRTRRLLHASTHRPAASRSAGFGGVAFASFAGWCLNLLRYRRFGPHGCSKCGTQLELLSEQEDDPKLLAGPAAGRDRSARSTTTSGSAPPA